MTTMPQPLSPYTGFNAVFDAWNRMVGLLANGLNVAGYHFDGLRRRVVKKQYVAGVLNETRDFYFSAGWQDLKERVGLYHSTRTLIVKPTANLRKTCHW